MEKFDKFQAKGSKPINKEIDSMNSDIEEMNRTMGLVHPSFPPQGKENKAHEGSQSQTPTKEEM